MFILCKCKILNYIFILNFYNVVVVGVSFRISMFMELKLSSHVGKHVCKL